jgi:hypothetical protein
MARPQVISGYPHGATTQGREQLPAVRILTANGVAVNRRHVPTAANRASQWIVQIVILTTSAFAVLDLYLLATGFHH